MGGTHRAYVSKIRDTWGLSAHIWGVLTLLNAGWGGGGVSDLLSHKRFWGGLLSHKRLTRFLCFFPRGGSPGAKEPGEPPLLENLNVWVSFLHWKSLEINQKISKKSAARLSMVFHWWNSLVSLMEKFRWFPCFFVWKTPEIDLLKLIFDLGLPYWEDKNKGG